MLVAGALVAGDGNVPGWEESVFHGVNGLPDWLYPIVWPGNLLGALVIVPIVAVLALSVRQYWLALAVVIAGVAQARLRAGRQGGRHAGATGHVDRFRHRSTGRRQRQR